jgi:signal transduction histidine kinase
VTQQPSRARDQGDLASGGIAATPPAPARALSAEIARLLGWSGAYVIAAWLGDLTVADGGVLPLFWPAAGVAVVWFATTTRRTLLAELVLLGVLAAGVAYIFDGTSWQVLNALIGVPLRMAVFVAASRRWAPGLWGTGGRGQLATLRQYGVLVAAVLVSVVPEFAVSVLVLWPDPGSPFRLAAELALSHTVAMVTVGLTGLLVGAWIADVPGTGPRRRVLDGVRRDSSWRDPVMAVTAAAFAVLVLATGYVWLSDVPVSFVLVMAVVAIGIRFTAMNTGLYALAISTAVCWLTALGHGPIAEVPDADRQILAFQFFAVALSLTGVTIAISRRERDATIERLRESEHAAEVLADDLTVVLASLEEGVAVVEEGGRFIHANAAIGRLLAVPDFNTDHVDPVDTYHLVHPDGSPLQESEVPHVRAFAGEENVHAILHLARPDVPVDRVFEVGSRLLPQIRSTDKPRAVTTVRDVTEEHLQRDALTSFAQVVAHDLRSPLTSVDLWARELIDGYEAGRLDDATGAMMAGHIHSAASRMQNFISDLLSYALARDQTPSPIQLELTDVVESVVETIVAVEGDPPDVRYADLPGVWCDPVLVPQLFDNLIGNARKYVAPNVVPMVRIEATPLPEDWVRVRVLDNGIGVAPEDRVRVFESFERAQSGDYEGTGLGLAICRHIVERHGGTIAITSPPDGVGTCVEMTLPASDAAFIRATVNGYE